MPYNPDIHHRRSMRLQGYDYRQSGAYFVTICVHSRICLFGNVMAGKMQLNLYGAIAEEEWLRTPVLRPYIELDEYIIMPNHFHGILVITDTGGAQRAAPLRTPPEKPIPFVAPGSLGAVMRAFKSAATKRINELRETPGNPIWQRGYYEDVVRNEKHLDHIRQYIQANPARWGEDQYYASEN